LSGAGRGAKHWLLENFVIKKTTGFIPPSEGTDRGKEKAHCASEKPSGKRVTGLQKPIRWKIKIFRSEGERT